MKLLKIIKANALELFLLVGSATFVLSNQFANFAQSNTILYAACVTALFSVLVLPWIFMRNSRPGDKKPD